MCGFSKQARRKKPVGSNINNHILSMEKMIWNSHCVHNTQWSHNSTLSCRLEPFRLCVCACLCACACLDVPERERRQKRRKSWYQQEKHFGMFYQVLPKNYNAVFHASLFKPIWFEIQILVQKEANEVVKIKLTEDHLFFTYAHNIFMFGLAPSPSGSKEI